MIEESSFVRTVFGYAQRESKNIKTKGAKAMTVNKETVDNYHKECEKAYQKMRIAKAIYEDALADYLKKSRRFRDLDYKLALTDGRLKKVEAKQTKQSKPAELTLDQIKEIAQKLGININSDESEVEEDEA